MSQFRSQKQNTPYCGFCRDAGKPENVYTSHYPKDRPGKYGKVICPTILSTTCGYCRKNGHTTRYCSSLKQRNTNETQRVRFNNDYKKRKITTNKEGWSTISKSRIPKKQEFVEKQSYKKKSPTNKVNHFAVLNDDEQDTINTDTPKYYNVDVPKVVKTAPVLKGAWGKGITSAIREEKKFEKKPVVEEENEFSNMTALGTDLNEIVEQVKAFREESVTPTGNWGDIVSSESEYESEYDSDSYSDYDYEYEY